MSDADGAGQSRAGASVIVLDPSTPAYREILLLAAAWNVAPAAAIGRLIDHYYLTQLGGRRHGPVELGESDVAVHRVYAGRRIEAVYHRVTGGVTVSSEPLSGRGFRSPSGARAAVVSALNPGVAPNGSGWDFWIVTATGKTLRSIRFAT